MPTATEVGHHQTGQSTGTNPMEMRTSKPRSLIDTESWPSAIQTAEGLMAKTK